MEEIRGRVIDIQQHRMVATLRRIRIEGRLARPRHREAEEIPVNKTTPRVRREAGTERHQSLLVPFDHRLEVIDHDQGRDAWILEGRTRGVAKAEPAHHHIEPRALSRKGLLRRRDPSRESACSTSVKRLVMRYASPRMIS